jgi:rare lipoprotein A
MMRRLGGLLWVVVALGAGGCIVASPPPPMVVEPTPEPTPGTVPQVVTVPPAVTMTGRASWYGEPHHGRLTASGEAFDMNALTAAHRSLPFGTRLRVVNLDNDREVEVRVNDRGPSIPGRVLDLSYAAARALGAVGTGVIPIRMTVVSSN